MFVEEQGGQGQRQTVAKAIAAVRAVGTYPDFGKTRCAGVVAEKQKKIMLPMTMRIFDARFSCINSRKNSAVKPWPKVRTLFRNLVLLGDQRILLLPRRHQRALLIPDAHITHPWSGSSVHIGCLLLHAI